MYHPFSVLFVSSPRGNIVFLIQSFSYLLALMVNLPIGQRPGGIFSLLTITVIFYMFHIKHVYSTLNFWSNLNLHLNRNAMAWGTVHILVFKFVSLCDPELPFRKKIGALGHGVCIYLFMRESLGGEMGL